MANTDSSFGTEARPQRIPRPANSKAWGVLLGLLHHRGRACFTPGGFFDLTTTRSSPTTPCLSLGEELDARWRTSSRAVSLLTGKPLIWDPDRQADPLGQEVKGNVTHHRRSKDDIFSRRPRATHLLRTRHGARRPDRVRSGADRHGRASHDRDPQAEGRVHRARRQFDDLDALAKQDGYYITTTIKVENMSDLAERAQRRSPASSPARTSATSPRCPTRAPSSSRTSRRTSSPSTACSRPWTSSPTGRMVSSEYIPLNHATRRRDRADHQSISSPARSASRRCCSSTGRGRQPGAPGQ